MIDGEILTIRAELALVVKRRCYFFPKEIIQVGSMTAEWVIRWHEPVQDGVMMVRLMDGNEEVLPKALED